MENAIDALKKAFADLAKAVIYVETVAPHAELEDIRSSLSILANRAEAHLGLEDGDLNVFREPKRP